jgi:hypothetical protein
MAIKNNSTVSIDAVDSDITLSDAVNPSASAPSAPLPQRAKPLQMIFSGAEESVPSLSQGLANLAKLPAFHSINRDNPIPGTEFDHSIMSMGQDGRSLLVIGNNAESQRMPFGKLVAIVENMGDREKSSIIIQNFQEAEYNKSGERPQIIARLNAEYSALIIAVGPAGRVIRKHGDINQTFIYYIPREELTAYYLMSKFQTTNKSRLESLLYTNDACRLIDLPLNPLMPRSSRDYAGQV